MKTKEAAKQIGINITGSSETKVVQEIGKVIMDILKSDNDQVTIQKALEAFMCVAKPSGNIAVSNVHIQQEPEAE